MTEERKYSSLPRPFTGLASVVLCASALAASFDSLTLAQGPPFDSRLLAQGRQTADVPAFEVASIKPNVSGGPAVSADQSRQLRWAGARHLRSGADRVVVDRTGLTGRFDWDLQWTREALDTSASPTGVSLFTAVREQLGLRLDAQRGMVDVLVIERVEKPTPD